MVPIRRHPAQLELANVFGRIRLHFSEGESLEMDGAPDSLGLPEVEAVAVEYFGKNHTMVACVRY